MEYSDPLAGLPPTESFKLISNNFENNQPLPAAQMSAMMKVKGGQDRSPQLSWQGAPSGTKSFVLTVHDPDAPTASGFWHWAVFDIPGDCSELAEGAGESDSPLLPKGAKQLINDAGVCGYIGAAPPKGHGQHRYFFMLHALSCAKIDIPLDSTPAFLMFNLGEHLLGRAVLIGTASR